MKFLAKISVMPHAGLLDPQGKAIANLMPSLDLGQIKDARIGKQIELNLEAKDLDEANSITDQACKKLLANPIMETYSFQVISLSE